MASSSAYTIALEITAQTEKALKSIRDVGKHVEGLGTSQGGIAGDLTAGLGSAMKIAGTLGTAVMGIGKAFFMVGQAAWSAFSTAFSIVKSIASTLAGLTMTGLKVALGGVAATIGAIYGTHKALGPAAEMERYKSQLDFMKKPELLDFYKNLALKSPLSLNETVSGGILSENFGLDSKKFLPLATDMAAAFKVPLEEILRAFGYIKSGRTGEGMESLRRFGISNADLEKLGVKFEKSGEVAERSRAGMLDAIYALANKRFSGMAEKGSQTYEGKVSNLGDAVFQAFAASFEKALPAAKQILDSVTASIGKLGAKLAEIKWDKFTDAITGFTGNLSKIFDSVDFTALGQKIVDKLTGAANFAERLTTPEGRQEIKDQGGKAWEILVAGVPKIFMGFVNDLKNAFNVISLDFSVQIKTALKESWDFIKQGIAMIGQQIFVSFFRMLYTEIGSILASFDVLFINVIAKFANVVDMIPRLVFQGMSLLTAVRPSVSGKIYDKLAGGTPKISDQILNENDKKVLKMKPEDQFKTMEEKWQQPGKIATLPEKISKSLPIPGLSELFGKATSAVLQANPFDPTVLEDMNKAWDANIDADRKKTLSKGESSEGAKAASEVAKALKDIAEILTAPTKETLAKAAEKERQEKEFKAAEKDYTMLKQAQRRGDLIKESDRAAVTDRAFKAGIPGIKIEDTYNRSKINDALQQQGIELKGQLQNEKNAGKIVDRKTGQETVGYKFNSSLDPFKEDKTRTVVKNNEYGLPETIKPAASETISKQVSNPQVNPLEPARLPIITATETNNILKDTTAKEVNNTLVNQPDKSTIPPPENLLTNFMKFDITKMISGLSPSPEPASYSGANILNEIRNMLTGNTQKEEDSGTSKSTPDISYLFNKSFKKEDINRTNSLLEEIRTLLRIGSSTTYASPT